MTCADKLMIRFKDHTVKIIYDVENYGCFEDTFFADKNGHRIFFPKRNVMYFGREFDLE